MNDDLKKKLANVINIINNHGYKIKFMKENDEIYVTADNKTIFVNTKMRQGTALLIFPLKETFDGVETEIYWVFPDENIIESEVKRLIGIISGCYVCCKKTSSYCSCLKCRCIVCSNCVNEMKKCVKCNNEEGLFGKWYQEHELYNFNNFEIKFQKLADKNNLDNKLNPKEVYSKLVDIWTELWNDEFASKKIVDKKEIIIENYVRKVLFCHNFRNKKVLSTATELNELSTPINDYRLLIGDKMLVEIFKEIQESEYKENIYKRYGEIKNIK